MLATIEDSRAFHPISRPWLTALVWLIASRLVIVAIGFVGVATFVDHHSLVIEGPAALSPQAVWHKWDALWYERIAVHGYGFELDTPRGQAAAAFFPLYPLAIGLLLAILPLGSFFWVGSAVSALCTLAACTLLVHALTDSLDHARRVLLVLLAAAGSFYFTIPYTEGLFLLLVVLAMVLTRRREYVWAGLIAGLAAVTRAQGLALIAIPLVACWLDTGLTPRSRGTRLAAIGALFAAPFIVYMLRLADLQGSAQAFIEQQAMWDNAAPYPFSAVVGLIEFPRRVQSYLHGGFWLLYIGLLVRYRRRLPPGEILFCLGALLISTQQATFQGIYRYTAVLVPLVLGVADDRPDLRLAIVVLNVIFGTIMILAFVTNNRLAV
jgi:Gpi18-like mannosyltransferase